MTPETSCSADFRRWRQLRDAALSQLATQKPCASCGALFIPPNSQRLTCSRSCAVALSWKTNSEKRRASIIKARRSPESRARTIEINNRRWAKPGEREKLSKRNKEMWAKPRMRKKLSKAIRAVNSTPAKRLFYSNLRTDQWANDSEYRRKTLEAMRRSKGTPESRAKFSALLTERWNDPAMRAKYTAGIRRSARSEERRAAISAAMRERWATDEAYRATVSAAMAIYHASPEASAVKSARMKALWADPIWKMRQLTLVSEGMKDLGTPLAAAAAAAAAASLNTATDLIVMVDRVVPRGLPDFIRSDVCQDIMVALLEGSLKLRDLNKGAKSYLTEYRKMFPDKFGPISLDAPIPGTQGLTLMDRLADDAPHF